MKTQNQQPPRPGYYRLMSGVRLVSQSDSTYAICDYPMRVMRLNPVTAQILAHCTEERTCEQLACHLQIAVKRVEMLCDQLRWKQLLEAGPILPPSVWPAVSIIIASYNRARELERCLRSLFELDYPLSNLEIIVVDDASTDHTPTILPPMILEAQALGLVLRVIRHQRQQGVAISRNTGAEAAASDLIAYLDSDCVASPGWLTELVPTFQDARIAAVGGMIRAYRRDTMLGRYEDVRSSLFMGKRPQHVSLKGPLTYLPTANLLIRRAIWQQLGGFAPLTFGEDVDFCRRLLLTGAQIHYLPYGIIYHDYRITFGPFLRIRIAYASAEAALLQRHPTERRILLLPPEQAIFASSLLGSGWLLFWRSLDSILRTSLSRLSSLRLRPSALLSLFLLIVALLCALAGTGTRLRKVRAQGVPVKASTVTKATMRGHLAYTYHLCRHFTRYYTLPLFSLGLCLPPLFLLLCIFWGTVIGVDYLRLRPEMGLSEYIFCSILDDCAYEIGVVQGCIKYRTWKPLLPMIKRRA